MAHIQVVPAVEGDKVQVTLKPAEAQELAVNGQVMIDDSDLNLGTGAGGVWSVTVEIGTDEA